MTRNRTLLAIAVYEGAPSPSSVDSLVVARRENHAPSASTGTIHAAA